VDGKRNFGSVGQAKGDTAAADRATGEAANVDEKQPMSTSEQSIRGGGGDEGGNRLTSWYGNSRSFLVEVRNEMRRVTWPSRKEVYATTFVVILTAMFFGLYLWGLDLAINAAVDWIYRQFGAA
jgi:preprotein translocase subunit SecE